MLGFNECELNCMPKGGDKFYYRHSQAVIDGTRCREDSLDICVQGICMVTLKNTFIKMILVFLLILHLKVYEHFLLKVLLCMVINFGFLLWCKSNYKFIFNMRKSALV